MSRSNSSHTKDAYRDIIGKSRLTDEEVSILIEKLSGLRMEVRTIRRWRTGDTSPPEAAIALLNLHRHLTVAHVSKAINAIEVEKRAFFDD